jgi:hypothetical protein
VRRWATARLNPADGFDLEGKRDLVADHAPFERVGAAELAAPDHRLGGDTEHVVGAPGIGTDLVELDLERDRPGDAADGEVAGDRAGRLGRWRGLGHDEADQRVVVRIEEVAAPEMVVAGLVVGEDALGVDLDHEVGKLLARLVEAEAAAAVEEEAQLLLVAEVAGAEQDGEMLGIDGPARHVRCRQASGPGARGKAENGGEGGGADGPGDARHGFPRASVEGGIIGVIGWIARPTSGQG